MNDELSAIERGLPAAFERLAPEGVGCDRFHSLEDRIVKRFCRKMAGRPEHAGDTRTQDERLIQAEDDFNSSNLTVRMRDDRHEPT